MTGKVFFDTNILVYAFAKESSPPRDVRAERAEELLAFGGTVSVQVLNEFADVATHRLKFSWESVEMGLGAITALCGQAVSLNVETHGLAVRLSRRFGFRIYDSLILAAAEQAGCTTLYTEDMQHGQTVGNVEIVNPFL